MNDLDIIKNVIAKRDFSIIMNDKKEKLQFVIGKPKKDSLSDLYYCEYQIIGPVKKTRIRKVLGVDAIHALQVALEAAGVELYNSKPAREGKLVWLEDDPDLGLPKPFNIK